MSAAYWRFVRHAAMLGTVCLPLAALAQTTPAPPLCVERPCSLVIDWGSGKTAASYASDIHYGGADDFESAVRQALTSHAVRLQEGGGALLITLRVRMDTRALCDRLSGTSTRSNCVAMSDVAVGFASRDSSLKAPGALRISNRCGEGIYASMKQFGQYVGDIVWMSLAGPENKGKKAPLRC